MLKIISDNKNYVVCEKPSGLISEYSENKNISFPAMLSEQLGGAELFTVHRLDKEVGGIMVYAKNKQTAAAFSQQIQDGRFEKEYIATVNKMISPDTAELSNLLFHDKAKNKTYVVKKKRNGVKEARLKYTLISYDQVSDSSTLRVKLYTGRTHQIRVQMSFIGHSIHGDKKYGSDISVKPIRLHSFLLSFYDHTTNKKETFTSIPDWIDNKSSEKLYSDTFC